MEIIGNMEEHGTYTDKRMYKSKFLKLISQTAIVVWALNVALNLLWNVMESKGFRLEYCDLP